MLDIQSNSRGVLIPRMTTAERTSIAGPANGLLVFDSTTQSFWFYNAGTWNQLIDATGIFWQSGPTNTYFTGGNVGIGDASPASTLTVGNGEKFQVEGTRGNVTFTDDSASIKFAVSAGTNTSMMYLFSSGTQNADRMIMGHSTAFPKWGLEYHDTSDVIFLRSTSSRNFAFELGSGDLGIGTTNPAFPIDMVGRMRIKSDGTESNRPGIWFSNQTNTLDRGPAGDVISRLMYWGLHGSF
jgi:hypothetical protein